MLISLMQTPHLLLLDGLERFTDAAWQERDGRGREGEVGREGRKGRRTEERGKGREGHGWMKGGREGRRKEE